MAGKKKPAGDIFIIFIPVRTNFQKKDTVLCHRGRTVIHTCIVDRDLPRLQRFAGCHNNSKPASRNSFPLGSIGLPCMGKGQNRGLAILPAEAAAATLRPLSTPCAVVV